MEPISHSMIRPLTKYLRWKSSVNAGSERAMTSGPTQKMRREALTILGDVCN
jgi:hypothetical protein